MSSLSLSAIRTTDFKFHYFFVLLCSAKFYTVSNCYLNTQGKECLNYVIKNFKSCSYWSGEQVQQSIQAYSRV